MPILGNFPGGGSGGNGIQLASVTAIETLAAAGKAYVKWTDPDDLVVSGSTLAAWAGTLLVRKAGSAPSSRRDGVIVLDSKTKNAYKDSYFCDSGLTDGMTYYYKLFPYSETGTYTNSDNSIFTVTPNPVLLGDASGITTKAAGNGKMSIQWTDPDATVVSDGVTLATWASTIVVVKEGSYADSPDDPDVAYTFNSTTRNAYATNPLVATGLTNGTTYYVSLFPMSTDGAANTSAANRKSGVANRIVVSSVPSQSGNFTYTGGAQSPTWTGYDSTKMTMSGDASKTDAGNYSTTFTLLDDYMWPDGTTTAKSIPWTISRAVVNVPTAKGGQTFTGSELTAQWNGYDSGKMTIGGTNKATNAGNYSASFTPGANFQWPDGTTTAKTVSWSIGKAAGSLSINKTSMSLDMSNLTGTIAVTRAGDGAVTASSSNSSIATVNVNGTTVTVTAKAKGSATITINVAAGTNHTAPASKTCAVTVGLIPSSTLNNNTPEVIQAAAKAGVASNYWSVGDKVGIALNGTVGALALNGTYYAFILGFNHNSSVEGNNSIHFQFGKTSSGTNIAFVDNNYSSMDSSAGFRMNTTSTNSGGWNGSYMRGTICPAFLSAMPTAWQSVIVACTKYSDNTGGGSDTASYVTSTSDKIWLLSEFEVQGNRVYANSAEQNYQKQYDYYKNGNSRVKYKHSATTSACYWWLRSVPVGHAGIFCFITASGDANGNYAYTSFGFAPSFKVA